MQQLPRSTFRNVAGVFGLAVALTSLSAVASPLPPGGWVSLSGTTVADRPELAGASDGNDLVQAFACRRGDKTLVVSGVVQSFHVRSDITAKLDFYFRIFVDAGSPGWVKSVEVLPYTGISTDVDYRLDGLGTVAPAWAMRDGSGTKVKFGFTPGLFAGDDSRFFFVQTDALYVSSSPGGMTLYVQDGMGEITCGLQVNAPQL